jgi:glyoxylase-like metal-dependent hydrolase (beta-lactamase superfamily II)
MPEGAHRFQVGSICCTVLADGYFSYPARWFFPGADPAALAGALEARRVSAEAIVSPCACLLIQTGRYAALVDTGAGDSSATTGALVARLEVEGLRPRDVDTVILTHAHPHHIGGVADGRGRSAFPNARYVVAEAEWDFWTSPRAVLDSLRVPQSAKSAMGVVARRALEAVRHQVEPIGEEAEVLPGVRVIPAPGHTPGHMAVLIASGNDKLLNIGDAASHPLHLEQPEWENGFDLDPVRAIATRRQLLELSEAEHMRVMGFHFPFPSFGRVAPRAGGGWTWSPGW